jgi:hypothetical protein
MNTTIILTSTVYINNNKSHIYQTDPNERLNTYIKSVLQWIHNTSFNIVLIENSGYLFEELKMFQNNRFEIITFKESELLEANYLKNDMAKGSSELFSINYAFRNSKIINDSQFIIKITARFFIPELEHYLKMYNLNMVDCLSQNNPDRCEMLGCHYKHFHTIFNMYLINENNEYVYHVEDIWKNRISKYSNIIRCKEFKIEKTQRGGVSWCFETI